MFGDTIQTITGIAALFLGIGYVIGGLIVNLHLSYYGVTEYQILRIKYLAVGLVYLANMAAVITLGAIVAGVLFLFHISQQYVTPAYDYFSNFFHVSIASAALMIIMIFAWKNLSRRLSLKGSLLFSWVIAESFGAFSFAYPVMIFIRTLALNNSANASIALNASNADTLAAVLIGEAILTAVLAVIGQLYFYSRYIYGNVSNLDPIGMGIPVNVQLAGREIDMTLIANMGIPLVQPDLTGNISLIDETDDHFIVGIVGINPTDDPKVFKINKELVKGIIYH